MGKYLLGIEQSGSQLKISALQVLKGRLVLRKLDKITPESISNWVASNLKNATEIKGYITIAESQTYLKEINLPNSSKKQLETAIYWELNSYSPIPLDSAIIDYGMLKKNKDNCTVVSILINEKVSQNLLDACEKANIKVQTIEPSSFAFSRVTNLDKKQNTLIITVEEEETNLLIIQNGLPVFTTSVSVEIERSDINKRRLSEEIINSLSDHAKKIVTYWQEKSGQIVNQIIVTGDISQKYYGLASTINKNVKIPVISAKIAKNLKIYNPTSISDSEISRFLLSIGAALKFLDKTQSINLIPKVEKEFRRKLKMENIIINFFKLILISSLALILISVFLYILNFIKLNNLERDISQTKKFVDNHPAQNLISDTNKYNLAIAHISTLIDSQKNLSENISIISSNKPNDVDIQSIDFSQLEFEEFTIAGSANRNSILEYYDSLAANSDSKKITMPYSNFENEKNNEFEIKILWK